VIAFGMVIAASAYVHNYGVAGTLSRYRATTTTGQGLLHQLSVNGWTSAAAGRLVRRQLYAAAHIYYTGGAWLAVHDFSLSPLLDRVSLCLALSGLGIALVRLRDDRCFLLIAWVAATFIGGQVLTDVPYSAYRAAPILPALAIAAGYAGAELVRLARRWYPPWRPAWQLGGLAALVAVVLPPNLAKLRLFLAARDSDPGTGMARLIGSQSSGPVYYLVSTGPLSELYTVRFLDEGRTVREVASLTDSLGRNMDPTRDAVFVLNPALNAAVPILRRCYPGGFLWSEPHPGGAYPVLAFWVPQPAVAAGRNCDMRPPPGVGLLARYFAGPDWDGAVVRERVEDWPLRWKTTADLKQFRSVMWSGWLQVPLAGPYRFQALLQSVWVDSQHSDHGNGSVDGGGGELATS
jgi:hypothetical protein